MPTRVPPPGQLDLFASPVTPHVTDEDVRLAAALPEGIRLGTSSWTFPGWAGVLYEGSPSLDQLQHEGLRAYGSHPLFRAVGLDRSYYRPLRRDEADSYGAALASAGESSRPFVMVSKVWSELTTWVYPNHPRWGERAGQLNPSFLHPERVCRDVLEAYDGKLAPFTGPFVFEIVPLPRVTTEFARELPRQLDALLRVLPTRFRYAIELRNAELLTPAYFECLHRHGAGHVFNFWSRMPPLGEQLLLAKATLGRAALGPEVVVRVMLPPGTGYEAQSERFAPFSRIADVQSNMRAETLELMLEAVAAGVPLTVLVNNKAEGCAPDTVRALATSLVTALQRRPASLSDRLP